MEKSNPSYPDYDVHRFLPDVADKAEVERDEARAEVERVRDLDLHQGSVHFPDECRRDCPGCAVTAALDGTEAGR